MHLIIGSISPEKMTHHDDHLHLYAKFIEELSIPFLNQFH